MEDRISGFEDLRVWQEAQNLAVTVYELVKLFPKDETFGLTSQIKRAAASVSVNIAEGFGRKTPKDKLQFYVIAYGSLLETKNFLYLAEKLNYLPTLQLEEALKQVISCQKLLNAFMRPLK
jgi:four helix bundle protein